MVHIIEKAGMDLSEYIGQSIYLRAGRYNNVIVDDKIFLHDIRAIHFIDGDGSHAEFVCYGKEQVRNDMYIYNVEKIIVDNVYWSKVLDYDQ